MFFFDECILGKNQPRLIILLECQKKLCLISSPFFEKILQTSKHPRPLIYLKGNRPRSTGTGWSGEVNDSDSKKMIPVSVKNKNETPMLARSSICKVCGKEGTFTHRKITLSSTILKEYLFHVITAAISVLQEPAWECTKVENREVVEKNIFFLLQKKKNMQVQIFRFFS